MGVGHGGAIFLLLPAFIAHLCSDSCSEAEFEHCLAVLQSAAQSEDLALATTLPELTLVCRKLQRGVKCIDEHSSRCFNSAELRVFDSVVSESRQVIEDLCIQGPMQEEYLRYAPCFKFISTEETKCASKFKKMSILSQRLDDEDKDVALKTVCCALTDFSACKKEHVAKDCTPGASQFLQRLTDRMSGSLINEHCILYTYGSDSCSSSSSSSGKAGAGYKTRMILIFMALFVSLLST